MISSSCAQLTDYLRKNGKTLIDLGWPVIPLRRGRKHPTIKGWQSVRATDIDVDSWLAPRTEANPNGGHAHGGGVGVLTERTPVIDVDCYNKKLSRETLAKIEELYGERMAFIKVGQSPKFSVMTYLPEGAPSFAVRHSAGYVDPNAPLRKDGTPNVQRIEILARGQQTVLYHVHPGTGSPYKWVRDDLLDCLASPSDMPEYRDDLTDVLFSWWDEVCQERGWTKAAEKKRREIPGVEDDPFAIMDLIKEPVGLTDDQIKRVLPVNEDLDYDEWVEVLATISHECQYDDPDRGHDLAYDWSAASDKHDDEKFEKTWRSFDHKGVHTFKKTMRSWLIDGEAADEVKTELRETEAEAQEKRQRKELNEMLDRYILIADGSLVFDRLTPPDEKCVKIEDFKRYMANHPYYVKKITKGGVELVRKNIADIWLLHEDRKSANTTIYDPNAPVLVDKVYEVEGKRVVKRAINSFYLPDHDETDATDRLDVFAEHMEYIIPDEREREWFVDWLAFNIQKPGKRCQVTPLHVSQAHGTGRGWIEQLLYRLLGHHNSTNTKMKTLAGEGAAGGFNDYLSESLICTISEVREKDKRYAVNDRIRDVLVADYLQINKKGGDMGSRFVYTNFFLQSNHFDALVLPPEDRRIQVLSGPEAVREDAYYNRIYAWLDDRVAVSQLFCWLRRRDLSRFAGNRSFDTRGRRRMIQTTMSSTEEAFRLVLNSLKPTAITERI